MLPEPAAAADWTEARATCVRAASAPVDAVATLGAEIAAAAMVAAVAARMAFTIGSARIDPAMVSPNFRR